MFSKATAFLLLGLFITASQATDSYFVNQRKEASMLISGVVNINADGSVRDYTLDHPEKLAAPVTNVVQQTVQRWKFQFATTPTGITSQKISMRLVAHMVDDQHASIRVAGTAFDDAQAADGENMQYKDRPHVDYPREALSEGAWGTVYLLVRIGKDGLVQEVSEEQTNLGTFAPAADMARYRQHLASAAIKAAHQWTFIVPTKGKAAEQPYWLVRVPVNFAPAGQMPADEYGQWKAYVPGPRQSIPWLHETQLAHESPDTVPNGTLHALGNQPRLSSESSGS